MTAQFSLARRLKAGETVHTGWCPLPYPIVAETLAREGFPAVTIDQRTGIEAPAATGYFVHVFVDRETRRPVPLNQHARTILGRLMPG